MNRFVPISLTAALALTAVTGAAIGEGHADKAAAAAVNARHAQMQLQAFNLGLLGSMAKAETPYDAASAQGAADNLNALAHMAPVALYPEGSEQGAAEGSRAKDTIWSDSDGFAEEWKSFAAATEAMSAAAGQDLDALRGAMGAVGKSCGSCHESFRGPKN